MSTQHFKVKSMRKRFNIKKYVTNSTEQPLKASERQVLDKQLKKAQLLDPERSL